jgi:hypothetical protein
MSQYPCSVDVEVARPEGEIPHYLPSRNPFLSEFAVKYRLPLEAALGGAETMYPEYLLKLRTLAPAVPPQPVAPPAPSPVRPGVSRGRR